MLYREALLLVKYFLPELASTCCLLLRTDSARLAKDVMMVWQCVQTPYDSHRRSTHHVHGSAGVLRN